MGKICCFRGRCRRGQLHHRRRRRQTTGRRRAVNRAPGRCRARHCRRSRRGGRPRHPAASRHRRRPRPQRAAPMVRRRPAPAPTPTRRRPRPLGRLLCSGKFPQAAAPAPPTPPAATVVRLRAACRICETVALATVFTEVLTEFLLLLLDMMGRAFVSEGNRRWVGMGGSRVGWWIGQKGLTRQIYSLMRRSFTSFTPVSVSTHPRPGDACTRCLARSSERF